MNAFLVIVGILVVWWLIARSSQRHGSSRTQAPPRTGATPPPSHRQGPASSAPGPNVFRPGHSRTGSRGSATIQFRDAAEVAVSDLDIADLVDALTGAPLSHSGSLYQCTRCKVFYQEDSVSVIRSENGSRCVGCLQPTIQRVVAGTAARGRNAAVSVITLNNYNAHVGHVITFEGTVVNVLISRRGTDYAVMFERKSWARGFKMVVFRRSVEAVGGPQYLFSLVGRRVRVRGLLAHHDQFGYQIIVTDRAMILSVS